MALLVSRTALRELGLRSGLTEEILNEQYGSRKHDTSSDFARTKLYLRSIAKSYRHAIPLCSPKRCSAAIWTIKRETISADVK